jgi:hypothetical protein
MDNPLPFGADTLVIPFTIIPASRPRPEPTPPEPQAPPRRE